jgi:hypothetical protein
VVGSSEVLPDLALESIGHVLLHIVSDHMAETRFDLP